MVVIHWSFCLILASYFGGKSVHGISPESVLIPDINSWHYVEGVMKKVRIQEKKIAMSHENIRDR